MQSQALFTPLAMHRLHFLGLGTALFSASFALNAAAMEPLSVSASDQGNPSLLLNAEQVYFMQSAEAGMLSDEEVLLPEAGQERHEPPKGHTLLDMNF